MDEEGELECVADLNNLRNLLFTGWKNFIPYVFRKSFLFIATSLTHLPANKWHVNKQKTPVFLNGK